jgi:hypothetical protein
MQIASDRLYYNIIRVVAKVDFFLFREIRNKCESEFNFAKFREIS